MPVGGLSVTSARLYYYYYYYYYDYYYYYILVIATIAIIMITTSMTIIAIIITRQEWAYSSMGGQIKHRHGLCLSYRDDEALVMRPCDTED